MRISSTFAYLAAAAAIFATSPARSQGFEYWEGFYIGGHGGYGWSEATAAYDTLEPNAGDRINGTFELENGLGGFQLGYNIQSGYWVLGVEGDWSFMDLSERVFDPDEDPTGTDYVAANIDWVASLRGRLGIAAGPALIYATAGAAWIGAEWTACDCETGPGQNANRASLDFDESGWVAGGGVEAGLGAGWTLRGEGLYLSFDNEIDTTKLTTDSDPEDYAAIEDIWVARIGLNYRFGMRREQIVPLK